MKPVFGIQRIIATTVGLALCFSGVVRGEQHGGKGYSQWQNGQQLIGQQQNGQQNNGMGGGGGSSGGGYESRREEIQKSFEQPAITARKAMTENTKAFTAEVNKMVQQTQSMITASQPKEEELGADFLERAQLKLSKRDSNDSGIGDIIQGIEKASQIESKSVLQHGQSIWEAAEDSSVQWGRSMADRIQGPQNRTSLAQSGANRAPASAPRAEQPALADHSAAARGFARGTVHNPPPGVVFE